MLSTEEAKRAAAFRFSADRTRFAVSHAALRSILSTRLGVAPADILFGTGQHGKPYVPGMEFNLTHSGDIALVATGHVPLGVDVERIIPLDTALLARNHFSACEQNILNSIGQAGNLNAFFEIWTGKEAFLKATGQGLTRHTDQFDVTPGPNTEVLSTRFDPAAARQWHLCRLDVREGYAAALCTKGTGRAIVTLRRFEL